MEQPRPGRLGDALTTFVTTWGLAIGLLVALVAYGGAWRVIANTRFLDLLMAGGVVRYHDAQMGLFDGITDIEDYVRSQDPVDWRLVALVAALYLGWWGVKAAQFHGIARFVGMRGSPGQHARAWIYGDGMGRMLPFRFGDAATITALEASGEDPMKARQAIAVGNTVSLIFEVFLFVLLGLFLAGWALWFAQMWTSLVLLGGAWWVMRRLGQLPWGPEGVVRAFRDTVAALSDRPATFLRLGLASSVAMLLDDLAPFFVALAFTANTVVIHTPFWIIQSGVVAGYIVRRLPITPGGIGQFEWAFVLALNWSGVALPDAVTIALIDSAIRHATGLSLFGVVSLGYGMPTSFPAVLRRYLGEGGAARVVPVVAA